MPGAKIELARLLQASLAKYLQNFCVAFGQGTHTMALSWPKLSLRLSRMHSTKRMKKGRSALKPFS
jgi:hypothetical protein